MVYQDKPQPVVIPLSVRSLLRIGSLVLEKRLKRVKEGETTVVEEVNVVDNILLWCSPSEDRDVSASQAVFMSD